MKPRIGITTFPMTNPTSGLPRDALNAAYSDAVVKSGGVPFLIPNVTDEDLLDTIVNTLDGFVVSGGFDVSPLLYNEQPHSKLGETYVYTDHCHIGITKKAIAAKKPFFGICRGHQVLNVACGGTLFQDVGIYGDVIKHVQTGSYSDISHVVKVKKGSKLFELYGEEMLTNSFHHQSVKVLGEGLTAVAHASDGIIEAIELQNHPFCMGVQWHPEAMLTAEDSMKKLFEAFINACK